MSERPKDDLEMAVQSLVDIGDAIRNPPSRKPSNVTGDMPYLGVQVMTNFDHSVEDGAEELLRTNEGWGDYPGWNFHGRVWFDRESERFACEVWVYGSPREVLHADSLRELMGDVSAEYGAD